MLNTFAIYTSLLVILCVFSVIASKRVQLRPYGHYNFWTWEIISSLLLFAFVFGVRYDVGIDYMVYFKYYSNYSIRDFEFLFAQITYFLNYVNLPVEVYFALWSFLQFFFLLYAFRNERQLLPFLILTLFLGQYFLLWTNVIRQDLATCIIIFALQYIREKKLVLYVIWVIIAMGFHSTALMCILFYPLFYKNTDYTKYLKVWMQLALLFACAYIYISNINILGDVDKYLNIYAIDTIYDQYAYGAIEHTMAENKIGLTFISGLLLDVMIIINSAKMKDVFNGKFVILYNLYFFGALFSLLFAQSFLLLRPVRYLRFFELLVLPYLLFLLYKQGTKKTSYFISFIFVMLLLLIQYTAIFFYSADTKYQYHSILLNL